MSTLLQPLQIITRRLPALISEPLTALIGQECYTTLVWNTNFDSPHCLRYALSKVLGLGIVLGGAIVKVPQILKIVRGRSARGLSLASYLLDSASLGITVAYNVRLEFPWSTYGENCFLLVQNIIITFLIVFYSSSSSRFPILLLFTVVLLVSSYLLASPNLVTPTTLQLLAAATIPLSLSSKLPQIVSNYRDGSTGQLSAFLVFNSLAGCLARVFTTLEETGDRMLFWSFFSAALLNGVLAVQMALYWKQSNVKERLTKGGRDGGEKVMLERIEIVSSRKSD